MEDIVLLFVVCNNDLCSRKVYKMKFTLSEMLNCGSYKRKVSEIDAVTKRNAEDLRDKINALGYGPAMYGSSFLRDIETQKRINPKAMGSAHLYGCALDIKDPDGKLAKWLKKNEKKLIECGLWMEDPKYTPGWSHLQSIRPASGNRYFIP